MASFQELEKGKYKLFVELGYRGKKRIRRTKTVRAKNKTEARKELIKFEAELLSKKIVDQEQMTLKQFYLQWKEKFASKHYSVRTLKETCNIIENRILIEFESVKLKDITKFDVISFIDELKPLNGKGELSPSSIHNIYKAFNSLMSVACDWDLIEHNPCDRIKLPKLSYKKGNVYDEKDTRLLFKLLESYPSSWQILVQLAAITGARQGEIVALEDKHVDATNNTITIEQALVNVEGEGLILKKTKTERVRKVSVPSSLMKELQKLKLVRKSQLMEVGNLREWKNHTFLFANEVGKPLRPDSVAQWWIRFMERNKDKLKEIRFHDLRHTSATLLISQGVHAKIIQERLGHSTIVTTMNVYGHVLDEADQTAASHFETLFDKEI